MKLQLVFKLVLLCAIGAAHSSVAAQQPQTGLYKKSGTANEILGREQAATFAQMIDVDHQINWEIQVPKNYDPSNPPGILIYISPQNIINIPTGWLNVTDEQNLIWIAALNSGNKILTNERMMMALLALPLLQSTYKINANRIYVTGFSGGGRVASIVASQFPHIIKGAIYNCGANFWNELDAEKSDIVKQNRFVFITGTKDFNLQDTKNVYGKYKKAGAENIKLMVISKMGHANPKRNKFKQAINYLDEH